MADVTHYMVLYVHTPTTVLGYKTSHSWTIETVGKWCLMFSYMK